MFFDFAPPVPPQVIRNARLGPSASAVRTVADLEALFHAPSSSELALKYGNIHAPVTRELRRNLKGPPTVEESRREVAEKRQRSPEKPAAVASPTERNPEHFEPHATVAPVDYQGRSYLHPPAEVTPAARNCRVPKRMVSLSNAHGQGVQAMTWASSAGNVLFVGDLGGSVLAWNVQASLKAPLATFKSHAMPITALGSADGGRLLTTSSRDGTIRVWDAERGVVSSACSLKGPCGDHIIHPEHSSVMIGAFDKEIALFDLRAGVQRQCLYQGHMGSVLSLSFLDRRGSIFVSSSTDRTLRTWDMRVAGQIKQFGDAATPAAVHVLRHPTEPFLLAQAADSKIRCYADDGSGKLRLQRDFSMTGHSVSGTSCRLAVSPDGTIVSSGDATGHVYAWSWETRELIKSFPAHAKQCTAHTWHPTHSSRVVTGGWDNTVKVWV